MVAYLSENSYGSHAYFFLANPRGREIDWPSRCRYCCRAVSFTPSAVPRHPWCSNTKLCIYVLIIIKMSDPLRLVAVWLCGCVLLHCLPISSTCPRKLIPPQLDSLTYVRLPVHNVGIFRQIGSPLVIEVWRVVMGNNIRLEENHTHSQRACVHLLSG